MSEDTKIQNAMASAEERPVTPTLPIGTQWNIPEGLNPPPPFPPPETADTSTYEGMEQDNRTGEAIVNGIPTGWAFARPTQLVPTADNPETGRQSVNVTPWGFASASTAQRVLEAMQAKTGLVLDIFKGDKNEQFPTSVLQRYIGVHGQPRRVAVNAGLIASYIARTTCEVSDGKGGKKIVQNAEPAIVQALLELWREIEWNSEAL